MEEMFTLKYGVGGICVLLTLSILVRVGEFIVKLNRKKEELSESAVVNLTNALKLNTEAMSDLERRLEKIEGFAADLPKLKNDVRRFYSALKIIAAEKWPQVRDEIMKDDFTL